MFQVYNSNFKKENKTKSKNKKNQQQPPQTKQQKKPPQNTFFQKHSSIAVQAGVLLNTYHIKLMVFKHVSMFAIQKITRWHWCSSIPPVSLKSRGNPSKQMLQFYCKPCIWQNGINLPEKTMFAFLKKYPQVVNFVHWALTVSKGNNNMVSAFHCIHLEISSVHYLSTNIV